MSDTAGPGFIVSPQPPLFGHRDVVGFGSHDFRVEVIDRDTAVAVIRANHYSGKVYVSSFIHLGVFIGASMVGVLQFGPLMNPASGPSVVRDSAPGSYLELNRMWLSDEAPRNSESRALAYSMRYIKRAYPLVEWVQSFADERCGRLGVVYQAANFLYLGEHSAVFWELDGAVYHNSMATNSRDLSPGAVKLRARLAEASQFTVRQFRYLLPLRPSVRGRLCHKVQPYPKPPPTEVAS